MSIASRIEQIEQHIGNAYDKIEDLGVDLANVDKNINNISTMLGQVWQGYPKVTATDIESAMLEGTKAGRMEIDLKGQTEQDTLTGKNLYNKDNANILNTPIDANGLGTNAPNTYRSVWIPCEANTTYTVSKLYDSTKNRFAVAYTTETPNYGSSVYGRISNNSASNITITTGADAQYLVAYVWISGGSTTPAEMIDSIQIEKGSTATSYEPYCGGIPSPNPSYPQAIKNVTGSANVKIQNKNLFDFEYVKNHKNDFLKNGQYFAFYELDNSFKTEFTVTTILKGTSQNLVMGFSDDIFATSHNELRTLNNGTIISPKTFNFSNAENVYFFIANSNTLTTGLPELDDLYNNYNIQLELGTTATTYVPHQEQNLPFTFAEGQRAMQGTQLLDDGIHNTWKQVVFDGSSDEEWTRDNGLSNTNRSVFVIAISSMKNYTTSSTIPDILSSHFIPVSQSATWKPGNISRAVNNKNLYIIMQPNMTLEQFKTWLSNNPVTIEFALADSELESNIIPYNSTQQAQYNSIKQARSYDDQTNISSTSDELGFKMDVESLRKNVN